MRALPLAVAALLGGAAAGCAARGVPIGAGPLAAEDLELRARLLAMADARRPDSALIELALDRARSGPLRAAAALAVGQVGARGMAPRLRVLLADGDSAVAGSAAFALGLLRDTASVDALAATYADGGVVAREAGWALGEIGAPARSAIEYLLRMGAPGAASSEAPPVDLPRTTAAVEAAGGIAAAGPAERAALLLAAQRLRPVPVGLVLPYLPDRNAPPADAPAADRPGWAAAYALTRTASPQATRALLTYIPSPDAELRAMVASGLRAAATGDSLATEAVPALDLLARDPHPHVRVNAVRALGSHGERAREALRRAMRDADVNVRVAAAQALTSRTTAPDGWQSLWEADTTFMLRRSLLASAARAGVSMSGLAEWSRSPEWRQRHGAAEALAGAPLEMSRALATALLRDPDGRVRAAALSSVAGWRDSAATEARGALRAALDDADFYVRATALGALADSATAAEVPAVLRSYARARGDSANDARIAAVAFLAAAWRRDSASFGDSLRAALSALPAPADPLEREPARQLSALRAWPGREGQARDLAWYRGVLDSTLQVTLAGRGPLATIVTERGEIVLELFGLDAPITVHNFASLARAGFYAGVRFHRVVPNFVAQDGDPRGDGNGSPGWAIRDELNRRRYHRGAVGMALSGADTGGSQYFLTLSAQPHLDGHYTVFGAVVRGHDVMDALVQGDRILRIDVR